jgi:hypothetical protein
MISTTLLSLQQAALNALAADPIYDGSASANGKPIPIITEFPGDIIQQIELCLGQVGIAALVITPTFEFHQPLAQDLGGWAYLNIALYEDAPVNQGNGGTGIQAVQLAEATVCILHWLPHGCHVGSVAAETTAATRFLAVARPIEFQSHGPPVQYNVAFQAHVNLNPSYP